MKKITGAITAIVTPFQKDGAVDVKTLEELVDFQVNSGIYGIVPCGSTGEAATMTLDDYELVVKTVVKRVSKRVPVIAGAGSNDTVKAITLSKLAKKAGADALLHVTPFYNKPTPAGLLEHYKAISKAVDLPIIIYNVPGRTGSNITAQTTLMLAKNIPSIIGIKEASGNINQMMEIIKGASKHFSVLSGDDAITLPLMAVGGVGIISVAANEIPKQLSNMVNAALEGNFVKAAKIHYKFLPLMNVNFIESNPIPVKTALSMMGKIEEVFRLPLVPINQKNREVVGQVLKECGLL